VLALATLGGLLTAPLPAALSRRVEARADRYALDLAGRTGEPAEVASAYAAMHRDLAVAARADLVPARWSYLVFASHPSAPERIAAARAWAAGRGAEVPGLTGAG
jgi:STE24 endopeptidase